MEYHLPLTRSAPFEDFPLTAGIETLFPDLPPPGMRPVEITATRPYGGSRQVIMCIVTTQDRASREFAMALRECADIDGFEVTARRYEG